MDLGRPPLARFPGCDERLSDLAVTQDDLDYAVQQVGEFGGDNRAGIDATLHRISCLRNRAGRIVGLTCRVGRAIHGSAGLVADLVASGASLLFMGRPGVGKTTAIRELSRLLADDLARRVVIVDTSNEIGGDGDVPHAGIGRARRMQMLNHQRVVLRRLAASKQSTKQQGVHGIMASGALPAVHVLLDAAVLPMLGDARLVPVVVSVDRPLLKVVVIDEIGTEAECSAARTIAQRGVQLVATAHGNELQNLIKNPALSDLIGGIQSVTLGPAEGRRCDLAARWHVYADVGAAVDALLAGRSAGGQMRERAADGSILKYSYSQQATEEAGSMARRGGSSSAGSTSRVLPTPPGLGGVEGGSSRTAGGESPAGAAAGGAGQQLNSISGSSSGGFVRPRLYSGSDTEEGSASTITRRGRSVRLGCASPDLALLRLYCYELDEERLWEVMTAMALHDKVYLAPRPAAADAVLAVRHRLKTNTTLRAAAKEAGVPVYAIKSSSSANLVRAFRTLLGLEPSAGGLFGSRGSMDDEVWGVAAPGSPTDSLDGAGSRDGEASDDGDDVEGGSSMSVSSSSSRPAGPARALIEEEEALEEARLAAEQIVLPLQQPVELLPRANLVRKAQVAMCGRYQLGWEVVGSGSQARKCARSLLVVFCEELAFFFALSVVSGRSVGSNENNVKFLMMN
eukprot:gene10824-10983_t